MRKIGGMNVDTETYIEALESSLLDILDANSSIPDIVSRAGVSDERAEEISVLYCSVLERYKEKHNLR